MTNDNTQPIPVSNWTLATGTQPGDRAVCIHTHDRKLAGRTIALGAVEVVALVESRANA